MDERLLQFIWQFQYFNRQELFTAEGAPVLVERPGMWNRHQGPDFSEAMVRIGTTMWIGNIELHIRSSDWNRHGHTGDVHYANIILHVVWENDVVIYDRYGNTIPALELNGRVTGLLLEHYRQMMASTGMIPCASFLPVLNELAWGVWKERLVAERLERRSAQALEGFQQSRQNWEEVFWWLLAANFGIKVNTVLFEQVAMSLPANLLTRHSNRVDQLEALLLGQANLLTTEPCDDYTRWLQGEHAFLQKKYKLQKVAAQPAFLRMRPAGFPTIRLAQLAVLLTRQPHLFTVILEAKEVKAVMQLFDVTAGEYWNDHYRLGEKSVMCRKHLGKHMAANIIINTIVPVLFAYGIYYNNEPCKEKAVNWLYQLRAEDNTITRAWQQHAIISRSALDSQALTELTNSYCTKKHCLNCSLGNKILKGYV